jgi:hypothetical protein
MNDHEFLAAFEAAAIPGGRWMHRDHVRIAFLYLRDLPFTEAVDRLRAGISALNVANGGQNTETSGYHETVTVAWARVIAAAIPRGAADGDFDAFAAANPQLFDKTHLLAHYTKERMLSVEARSSFIEPDVAPLPDSHVGGKPPNRHAEAEE